MEMKKGKSAAPTTSMQANTVIERRLGEPRTGRLAKQGVAERDAGSEGDTSQSARLLKTLRLEAGLSLRAMAQALSMSPTSYQHYESRYKRAFLPYEFVEKVKPILLAHHVRPDRLEGLTPDIVNVVDDVSRILRAPLISWVQAGAFEEAVDPYSLGGFEEEVAIEYDRESVIALRVRGSSINRVAPDGSILIVDYSMQDLVPEKFFVIKMSGEATVKRYMANPDRFEPFSTEPDHPIILPSEDLVVVGRVVRVVTSL